MLVIHMAFRLRANRSLLLMQVIHMAFRLRVDSCSLMLAIHMTFRLMLMFTGLKSLSHVLI